VKIASPVSLNGEVDEIAALTRIFHETEQQLEQLTRGEVDTISDAQGRTLVLRRAQEQLRRSEAVRQDAILDALPARIALLDREGFIVSVNETWRRFVSANALQVLAYGVGRNYLEICDLAAGEDSSRIRQVAAAIRSVLRGELATYSIEYSCHSPTEQRWFELTVSPLPHGGQHGAVVMHMDISNRRLAEEVLHESEERFAGAFEHAAIGMALVATDGHCLRVNRSLCNLFGYTEAELLTRSLQDLIHPEDVDTIAEILRETVADDNPGFQLEKRYVHKNGSVVRGVLNIALVRDSQGHPRYFVAQIQDVTERRLAEDELREINEKFHQLADNITDVFWIRSADMREVHYVSPAFEQIWGRPAESLYASPAEWCDFVVPEDRDRAKASVSALAREGVPQDIEYRIFRPSGEIRWVRHRGVRVTDASGTPIRNIGVITDITDKQRSAAELRRSEEEFRTLAESMPQIVWIARPDGGNVYCNQQWVDYTGLTLEETCDDGWNLPFHPDDQERALEGWQQARMTGGIFSVESRLRRADGTYRWWLVRGVPSKDTGGTILKWFGTCTDVHDMKVAELEISRSNRELELAGARLLAAQRLAKMGSWETDLTTMSASWSDETRRIFEYDSTATTIPHAAFLTFIHPEDRMAVDAAFRESLLHTNPVSIEHRLLLPDGRIKFVEEHWQMAVDTQDRPVRATGTCQDITERKFSEIALHKVEAALRQAHKLKAVGQLAAGVAHEFNNILQTLLSMATITRLRAVSPEIVKIATQMEVQIRRGSSVTRQLLLASRSHELTKTSLDLCEQVAIGAELVRRLIPENIDVLVETAGESASVDGDAGQIQQVLLNLAINARDAMPDGGTLVLRVSSDQREVFLDVEDDGTGFDEAAREHIFEPFFTTKQVGEGTGLGLSVVQGIVEQHGGRIEVRSQPGEGSRFRVILPKTEQQRAGGTLVRDPEIVKSTGRILLVEDEEGVREGITLMLQMFGYEVIAVGRGEAAMALPLSPVPDMLLSDVALPGIGGPALAEHLRIQWPALKVTLMTGYVDEATRSLSRSHRCDVLQKPFEMDVLGRHLEASLSEKNQPCFVDALFFGGDPPA
jgi:PAS domain S-box-containing protein